MDPKLAMNASARDAFEGLPRGQELPDFPNPDPGRFADTEWRLRVELAVAYRLIAQMGMDDAIFTHLSVRVPGDTPAFLVNAYGMLFDEVTASSLIKVDVDGRKLSDSAWPVNPAGFNIHSAIHLGSPHAHCIFHTHTLAGMAVAADPQGLRPLNQISLHFYNRIGRYSYNTIHFTDDEKRRMVAALGNLRALIMECHGLLTCGATVADAFYTMYYLERACRLQVKVLATPGPHLQPAPRVCEEVAQLFDSRPQQKQDFWIPHVRRVLRQTPEVAS
jgi:ribulose-5-phosphate 4-epimerase/fuculose-1-phosphate aldolase